MDPLEDKFGNLCPILDRQCDPNCKWRHCIVYVDEDGIESKYYCAINLIASSLQLLGNDEK